MEQMKKKIADMTLEDFMKIDSELSYGNNTTAWFNDIIYMESMAKSLGMSLNEIAERTRWRKLVDTLVKYKNGDFDE